MFSHITRLVVTAQHDDVAGVLNLQAEEVSCDLWTIVASVNIVSQEEHLLVVVGTRAALNLAKHGHKIIVLAVNIANDDDLAINAH